MVPGVSIWGVGTEPASRGRIGIGDVETFTVWGLETAFGAFEKVRVCFELTQIEVESVNKTEIGFDES